MIKFACEESEDTGCACPETFVHIHIVDCYGWEVVVPVKEPNVIVDNYGVIFEA